MSDLTGRFPDAEQARELQGVGWMLVSSSREMIATRPNEPSVPWSTAWARLQTERAEQAETRKGRR